MKNILIINLRRYGDLYSTGHLINSIKSNDPDTNISLLMYDEFSKVARTLPNIDQFFMINRKKVISLRKNPIFSPAMSIEKLYSDMIPVTNANWDQIINFSNDKVGTFITSYLLEHNPNASFSGIRFITSQTITHSSPWAIMFNDILPCYKHTPIHFIDCYHQMTKTTWKPLNGNYINTHPKHDKSAKDALDKVRRDENKSKQNIKLVGLQLKSSDPSKDIHAEDIIELINNILDNPTLYPILLIAPFTAEQELANDINSYFDDTLVIVETDLYGLGSVLNNLDCIITPDTFIKHKCDLIQIPIVEVSKGKSPFLKQGTYNELSCILTPSLTTRSFSNESIETESRITASDIYQALLLVLNKIKLVDINLSDSLTIYKPIRDTLGISYQPIAGNYDVDLELSRYISRFYIMKSNNIKATIDLDFFKDVKNFRLITWLDREKNAVTELTRDLLSTLKHLLLSQKNKTKSKDFIISLERLLTHCEKDHIVTIPILEFRAIVDSLTLGSINQNIQIVEELLYKLKANVQTVLTCFKELNSKINENNLPKKISSRMKSKANMM